MTGASKLISVAWLNLLNNFAINKIDFTGTVERESWLLQY